MLTANIVINYDKKGGVQLLLQETAAFGAMLSPKTPTQTSLPIPKMRTFLPKEPNYGLQMSQSKFSIWSSSPFACPRPTWAFRLAISKQCSTARLLLKEESSQRTGLFSWSSWRKKTMPVLSGLPSRSYKKIRQTSLTRSTSNYFPRSRFWLTSTSAVSF